MDMIFDNKQDNNPFEGYVLSKTTPFLRNCSLCNASRKTLYEVPIDGIVFLFCSIDEARQGIANYKANKKKGLTIKIVDTLNPPTITEET